MSNPRRNALGRGLSALLENAATDITTAEPKPVNSISEVLISQVEANPFQPRTDFKEEELNELAESIKIHGVIQPITVRKIGFDRYQLISGERRTRASRIAGLEKIPAFIRLADDQGMLEMALIENIQRENLNAMEVALSYKRLMDECKLNQEELGDRVGKNRSTVNNYMRLLKLPDNIQASLRDDKISMGHARAIINIDNADEQQYLFNEMILKDLSVRQVEAMVREASERAKQDQTLIEDDKPKNKKAAKPALTEVVFEFQKLLSDKFGNKVKISNDEKGKGNITIPFKSENDLNKILDMLS
jgi:ParB family chromosome partitioning protein